MQGVLKSVSNRSMIRKAGEPVTHLLSAWETPENQHGPTARFRVWVPAETTCLGRKTPYRCMRHAAAACSDSRQHF